MTAYRLAILQLFIVTERMKLNLSCDYNGKV